MNDIVTASGLGKSYRTYGSEINRAVGWLTGHPYGYTENWVLNDISFSLSHGESLGILGRNGAGKSTLLKLMANTISPTKGKITVNGQVSAILELGVGFNPDFTGRENVLHSLVLAGRTQQEALGAVDEIRNFADIGDYFDKPMRIYSTGMSMRVSFAAATAFRPDLLIIDEALAVGDAFFQSKCFERIRKLREDGTALIYVSHSAGEIAKYCDQAIFLKNGGVQAIGTAREVSNIYLDDLFGKGRPGALAFQLPSGVGDTQNMDTSDVFATRPFYRKDEYRWGDGRASIVDYIVSVNDITYPSILYTKQKAIITFKVLFKDNISRPVFGLLIKTLDGAYVYGTNSELSLQESEKLEANTGDLHLASFEVPMLLNTGNYLVSLGVSEEGDAGDLIPLDRRYDSFILPVENQKPGVGHIDLGASFKSKTLKSGAIKQVIETAEYDFTL